MRTKILEEFRDKVLKTVTTRHGGVLLFAGQADPAVVAAVRDSIPDTIILFYLFPGKTDENKLSSLLSHGKNMTLFSSLEDDQFPHEKAGILLTLKPSENTCLKADNSIEEKYLHTIEKINEAIEQALSNAEQSRLAGLLYFRSSLRNLPHLLNNPRKMLKNNDASVTAVICCGGPSFAKALPLLKTYQDRIAIFAIARTSALLIDEGIKPDVLVHVDPYYDVSWSRKASEKNCVLAASLSVSAALSSKFSDIIWFNGDADTINNYAEAKAPGILNRIAISRTVTISAIDLAIKAGFRKIILTGSDLCVSGSGKSHVDDSAEFGGSLLQVEGNSGEKVYTTQEFEALRTGIESYLDALPHKNFEIYNCTDGGALIKNIPHRDLSTFLEKNTSGKKTISLESSNAKRQAFNCDMIISDMKKLVAHTDSKIAAAESFFTSIRSGRQDEIKKSQDIFNKLAGEKIVPTDTEVFKYFNKEIDGFLDNTMNRLPELRTLDLANPLTKLVLFIKRSLLQRDLCCDFIDDMEGRSQPDRRITFSAFSNFALRFIAASNPELADKLGRIAPGSFGMVFSLQELPNIVQSADTGKTIFSYSVAEYNERAQAFADKLEKEFSFDQKKDALVFPAPLNYLNIVEVSKKFPDADIMIVEPCPEFLKQLISSAMFFHEIPEKTVIAEVGDLNGIVASTIKSWQAAGKRILVVNTPENNEIKEAETLTDAIRRMLL